MRQLKLDQWQDADGQGWAMTPRPLSTLPVSRLIAWLPTLSFPHRVGRHSNTMFALLGSPNRANALTASGYPVLREAIQGAAKRVFATDNDYPARYEPGGPDFLSGALLVTA